MYLIYVKQHNSFQNIDNRPITDFNSYSLFCFLYFYFVRYERNCKNNWPVNQHSGSNACGPDHVIRFPFHRLWFYLGLEPVLHVLGVLPALESLSEDSSACLKIRTEEHWWPGAEASQQTKRFVVPPKLLCHFSLIQYIESQYFFFF